MGRTVCGLLLLLVSGCGTFDFGDALATADVFATASDIKECRERAGEDNWAVAACEDLSGW